MRTNQHKLAFPILALSVALLGACDAAERSAVAERGAKNPSGEVAAPATAREDEPTSLAGNETQTQSETMGADWEGFVAAEVERVRQASPERYDAIRQLEPRSTRADLLRFTGDAVRHPDAAPLLLARYLEGNESPQVRAALVEALPRTGGVFGPAVADLLARERDPGVRSVMVHALRRADAPSALAGFELGLADSDAGVRAEAARSIAYHAEGAALAQGLISATNDPSSQVAVAAARSLGVLKVEAAKEPLVGLLGSDDAEVRLHALRALSRIDEDHAASLEQTQALIQDSDPRVAKLAAGLSSTGTARTQRP